MTCKCVRTYMNYRVNKLTYLWEKILWQNIIYGNIMESRLMVFAWTYQPCLSGMVQCFSLTTKQHQPAYQPQKPSAEQFSGEIFGTSISPLSLCYRMLELSKCWGSPSIWYILEFRELQNTATGSFLHGDLYPSVLGHLEGKKCPNLRSSSAFLGRCKKDVQDRICTAPMVCKAKIFPTYWAMVKQLA